MLKHFLILLLLATSLSAAAQEHHYVVIHTSRKYISARLVAEQAAKILNIKLDLRQLKEHPSTGLSLPRNQCVATNGQLNYPLYPTRRDNANYISVEYSSAYKDWAQGYYLVVIASNSTSSASLTKVLSEAQNYYGDAYIKRLSN